eukprot:1152169-Pelagomonas_calceolata.AAC.1
MMLPTHTDPQFSSLHSKSISTRAAFHLCVMPVTGFGAESRSTDRSAPGTEPAECRTLFVVCVSRGILDSSRGGSCRARLCELLPDVPL